MMEIAGGGKMPSYLNPDCLEFREGKVYPREEPGLGVEFDSSMCQKALEITGGKGQEPFSVLRRPDGSYTNW